MDESVKLEKKISRTVFLFFFFSLTIAFVLTWQGYCLNCTYAQAQLIPFAHVESNPELYGSDAMVSTKKDYHTVLPFLWGKLFLITEAQDSVIFFTHMIWIFMCFSVIYLFATKIMASRSLQLASVIIFIFNYPMFYGYASHYRSIFTQPSHNLPGFAFGLLAVLLRLYRKRFPASIFLAIGFYFHSLSILHLFILLFAVDVYELFFVQKPKSFFENCASQIGWSLPFLALISPLLWLEIKKERILSLEALQTFINVNALDSFPLYWSATVYLDFATFFMLLYYLWKFEIKTNETVSHFFRIMVASCLLSIAGIIGVHFLNLFGAIILQATRSTVWIGAFSGLFLVASFPHVWQSGPLQKIAALLTMFAIAWPGWDFTFVSPLIGISLLLLAFKQRANRTALFLIAAQFTVLVFWFIYNQNRTGILSNEFKYLLMQTHWLWAISFLFALAVLLNRDIRKVIFIQKFPRQVAFLSIIFCFVVLFTIYNFRDKFLNDSQLAWKDVQTWASRNTNSGDVFLTPYWIHGFRVHSKRPVFLEWQDGTQQYFTDRYGPEYRRRIRALEIDTRVSLAAQKSKYHYLSENSLRYLVQEYGVRFYVMLIKESPNHDWPVQYKNEKYQVIDLQHLFEKETVR